MNFKLLKRYSLDQDFEYIMSRIRQNKNIKSILGRVTKDSKIINYSFNNLNDNIYEKIDILDGRSLIEYGNLKSKDITKIMDTLYYGRHMNNPLYFKVCENVIITVLKLFIESKSTEFSFVGKVNSSDNLAVSKLSNFMITSDRSKYITEIDIDVDNMEVDNVINNIKKFYNIKDTFFLSVLKRFMFSSEKVMKYAIECSLIPFDEMMENERIQNLKIKNYFTPKKIKLKGMKAYNDYRNGRTYPSIIRHYNKIMIITASKEEAMEINDYVNKLCKTRTVIKFSDTLENSHIIKFLDYKISNKKENITLSIEDNVLKDIKRNLKILSNKSKNTRNYYNYVKYVVSVFYKYRICTGFKFLITLESKRLFRDLHHSKNTRYSRGEYIDGTFNFNTSNKYRQLPLNFWKIRELSNTSFSRLNRKSRIEDFQVESQNPNILDFLRMKNGYSEYIQFIPALLEKQNFKCPVSNINLNYNNYEVHRMTPKNKGGENELSNLIIIHKDVHSALHKGLMKYDNKLYKKLYNKIHK